MHTAIVTIKRHLEKLKGSEFYQIHLLRNDKGKNEYQRRLVEESKQAKENAKVILGDAGSSKMNENANGVKLMHEHHNHFDFILNAAEQLVKRQAQPPERVMYKTVRKVIQYDVTRRNFLNALNDICRLLTVPLNSYVLTRDSKDYDLYHVQVHGSGPCYYSTTIRIDSSFKNRFKVNLPSQ